MAVPSYTCLDLLTVTPSATTRVECGLRKGWHDLVTLKLGPGEGHIPRVRPPACAKCGSAF